MEKSISIYIKALIFIFLISLPLGYFLDIYWFHVTGIVTGFILIIYGIFREEKPVTREERIIYIGSYVIKTVDFKMIVIALILLSNFLCQEEKEVNVMVIHLALLVFITLFQVRIRIKELPQSDIE